MQTTLGTVGKVIDNSHSYARGSFEIQVSYKMDGIAFKAVRFVRTDIGLDVTHLYIQHESSWCDDYLGAIAYKGPADMAGPMARQSRHSQRAMELLALALADVPGCTAERFALIELS